GDQASIVGGAINFVKELEQQLQTLEAQRRANKNSVNFSPSPQPFSDFFSFPQYSIRPDANDGSSSSSTTKNRLPAMAEIELEDGCQLSTVDEIADAVNCLLFRIEEEESLCSN
ncbi:hypothetical protein Tco_1580412, partial [Tanacetum coccineum]